MTGNTRTSASGQASRAAGTFVIPWPFVEVEGAAALPPRDLATGQEITLTRWPQRLDGPGGRLLLDNADGVAELHARAARIARIFARQAGLAPPPLPEPDDTLLSGGMVLTDGRTAYPCALLAGRPMLLAFQGRSPAPGDRLWIARIDGCPTPESDDQPAVVCFAAGTLIATTSGPRPVETLQEGDPILTRDNGPMPLRWRGQQRLSGARLKAMPGLRPIRIRAGALGFDRPDGDLLLSPDHRVLVSGPAAAALFGVREVLVRAGDLRDAPGVSVDLAGHDVTYVHLALDGHQVLEAAGLPVESFDPATADLRALDGADRARLFRIFPALKSDNGALGPQARRVLKTSEAAILGHRIH